MGILKKQRGFTVIEVTFVLAIIAIISGITFSEVRFLIERQRTEEAADSIRKIYTGSIEFYNTNTNTYTGLNTMADLCSNGYVNADICTQNGSGRAPWGGDYTAAGSGTQVTITATDIPTPSCNAIVEELQMDTTISSATCSSNEVTAVYYSNA